MFILNFMFFKFLNEKKDEKLSYGGDNLTDTSGSISRDMDY